MSSDGSWAGKPVQKAAGMLLGTWLSSPVFSINFCYTIWVGKQEGEAHGRQSSWHGAHQFGQSSRAAAKQPSAK